MMDGTPAVEEVLSAADLRHAVLRGLSARPRSIPPKFFYDSRGSRLFDAICRTPEYYPMRTECALLQRHAGEIAEAIGTGALLVEPGSGSCTKVRLLLDALRPSTYVPMDICREYVEQSAKRLREEFPWLTVRALWSDFTRLSVLPEWLPEERRVVFFPGSTIGNLEPDEAAAFLGHIGLLTGAGGGLLVGVDLKKEPAILHAAYNDANGVTAEFNRNLLLRINRELDGDFDPRQFDHRAWYDARRGRVEMHLMSRRHQSVRLAGHRFLFRRGDGIHTENSYKYGIGEFARLAVGAGLQPQRVWVDEGGLFSLHYLTAGTA